MQTGKINQRITYFMEQRQMGLESLSQKTGLDTALLDTMLTEDVYPPLGPLMKIARALGVRLGTFLDDQESTDPYIVRKAQRQAEFSVLAGKNKPAALNFLPWARENRSPHGTLFRRNPARVCPGKKLSAMRGKNSSQ